MFVQGMVSAAHERNGLMRYRVEVTKRLILAIEADSEPEARALAMVTATGVATPVDQAAVQYLGKVVEIETLAEEPVGVVP